MSSEVRRRESAIRVLATRPRSQALTPQSHLLFRLTVVRKGILFPILPVSGSLRSKLGKVCGREAGRMADNPKCWLAADGSLRGFAHAAEIDHSR